MPAFLADSNALRAQPPVPLSTGNDSKGKNETLFGPALGAVQAAPEWTSVKTSSKDVTDELTPEIVRSWIAKSKDVGRLADIGDYAC